MKWILLTIVVHVNSKLCISRLTSWHNITRSDRWFSSFTKTARARTSVPKRITLVSVGVSMFHKCETDSYSIDHRDVCVIEHSLTQFLFPSCILLTLARPTIENSRGLTRKKVLGNYYSRNVAKNFHYQCAKCIQTHLCRLSVVLIIMWPKVETVVAKP